jgi:hypothetical protein
MWGIFPSFRFRVLVARFWHFENGKSTLWDETKIGLCGIPRYPKVHACIQYGLVTTNYAMIRAEPGLFDLKAMQPRT